MKGSNLIAGIIVVLLVLTFAMPSIEPLIALIAILLMLAKANQMFGPNDR